MKKFLVFILSIFIAAETFAQMSVNPQHEFYSYAQEWYLRGYVEELPPLRPYPVSKIKQVLTSVLEKTEDDGVSDGDFLIASRLYEELTGKNYHVELSSTLNAVHDSKEFQPFMGQNWSPGFLKHHLCASEHFLIFVLIKKFFRLAVHNITFLRYPVVGVSVC